MGEATRLRRDAVMAGHEGNHSLALELLGDADPSIVSAAVGALLRLGQLRFGHLAPILARHDGDSALRRRCLRACAQLDEGHRPSPAEIENSLVGLLDDPDPTVAETAAFALGEFGCADTPIIDALSTTTTDHADSLCREAAVAALGALGHPRGLDAVLAGTTDIATIRRRATLALAAFTGPEVTARLRELLDDRDRTVRQSAEDLLAIIDDGKGDSRLVPPD